MKKVINFLDLHFEVIQFKWGRKLFKGTYYRTYVVGIPLNRQIFWSDVQITSCQSETLEVEKYD